MTPWEEMNTAAADYIVRLWGARRREFARRYWAFLAYGMPKPDMDTCDCFGAEYIKDHLIEIKQSCSWSWERR